jgi:hypothetical protein
MIHDYPLREKRRDPLFPSDRPFTAGSGINEHPGAFSGLSCAALFYVRHHDEHKRAQQGNDDQYFQHRSCLPSMIYLRSDVSENDGRIICSTK